QTIALKSAVFMMFCNFLITPIFGGKRFNYRKTKKEVKTEIMDKNKSIETLQFFTTGLSNGAFVHKVQGQIIKSANVLRRCMMIPPPTIFLRLISRMRRTFRATIF
ncbi:MAG: hypothetical protein K2J87_02875, partial [Muribaculaceae bacterium]|nr:hypothetical protein [Muribaculaceae bacterium]